LHAEFNENAVEYVEPRPIEFALDQDVADPFNPSTTTRFGIPEATPVRLAIYDANGPHVLSSGVYVYLLTHPTARPTISRRMLLLM
jgi:hypothetical protein